MLYDGAAVAARMDRSSRAAKKARLAAETLLDVATDSGREPTRRLRPRTAGR
jgi:hypothetical protein